MTKKELLARIEELERRVALLEAAEPPTTWTPLGGWTIQPTPMPAFGEGWIASGPFSTAIGAGL